MAETTHPIRRLGTRAALLSIGMALGVTLAPHVVGAADQPAPPAVEETDSTVPVPATVGPAATSTSTTSSTTSTSSTSTSSTTTVTTPPTVDPPVLVPPLVDFRQPAKLAAAVRVDRVVAAAPRPATRPRAPIAAGAELPFTGGGTVSILMSGLTALGIGGVAVWWGSRKRQALIPVETNPTE